MCVEFSLESTSRLRLAASGTRSRKTHGARSAESANRPDKNMVLSHIQKSVPRDLEWLDNKHKNNNVKRDTHLSQAVGESGDNEAVER